jgi:hypothetical protein
MIGLPAPRRVGRLNSSRRRRDGRAPSPMSDASRRAVETRYREDFEIFRYPRRA